MAEIIQFKDHFSTQSGDYTRYRPGYPEGLFAWLAAQTEDHDIAWDCGCGNGQASVGLAPYYQQVIATDPSRQQIEKATPNSRIRYAVASAEHSGLADSCIDTILVAQALHWFDFARFYEEVRRVAKPGAVLMALSYGELQVSGPPAAILSRFYHHIISRYWPPERRYVDDGYTSIPFPFARIDPPPFAMQAEWHLGQLLGYLGTWSAVAEYRRMNGRDPLALVEAELRAAWGDAAQVRLVSWPLALLAGHVTA
ncbi:MAG: class I SAM-dependent methyltransferase [Desulfuromonadaceae bacterium]|nr:class I SAM-dependent methyltransferase [Desulfuromonadaceae bacterium]MDD5106504.1 class I SAM-dependent methyltransferase [Desulfuromonadaceae bacterium]